MINSSGGSAFVGMPRFEAREALTIALQEKVLYIYIGVCRFTCVCGTSNFVEWGIIFDYII